MKKIFSIKVITLFPDSFPGTLGLGVIGKALKNKLWKLQTIDIRNFGNNELILQDISLNIPCGKKIGIMGASGSGKTTLFNSIIGFIK